MGTFEPGWAEESEDDVNGQHILTEAQQGLKTSRYQTGEVKDKHAWWYRSMVTERKDLACWMMMANELIFLDNQLLDNKAFIVLPSCVARLSTYCKCGECTGLEIYPRLFSIKRKQTIHIRLHTGLIPVPLTLVVSTSLFTESLSDDLPLARLSKEWQDVALYRTSYGHSSCFPSTSAISSVIFSTSPRKNEHCVINHSHLVLLCLRLLNKSKGHK